MKNWKLAIVALARAKELVNTHDKYNAFPWHLPRVAATADRIAEAEHASGITFSDDYRSFLQHADGWKSFNISVDLFGTEDVLEGRAKSVKQREAIASYIDTVGLSAHDVLPIAASETETDVFLLVSAANTAMPGKVLWWGDEEIEHFEDFWSFFVTIIGYTENRAKMLATKYANEIH